MLSTTQDASSIAVPLSASVTDFCWKQYPAAYIINTKIVKSMQESVRIFFIFFDMIISIPPPSGDTNQYKGIIPYFCASFNKNFA